MQLYTKSGKALYTKSGFKLYTKVTTTPPTGQTSYWQANHPVTHGYQLIANQSNFYADKLGVYAGIPPGTTFTSNTSGDWTISTGGVYTDVNHSGRIIVDTNDPITLVRVRARQTSALYTLEVPSPYGANFKAIDCEFSGGTSITILASGLFLRCLGYEGNDGIRPRGTFFEWTESVYWWVKRSSESSHSDALQFTNGAPGTINQINAERSVLSAWNPDTQDNHNSAIQTGGWQGNDDTSGVAGQIVDCFVDGGHVCVNAGGGSSWPMVTVAYRRNRFGLMMDSGPKQATGGNVVWENTNVWHSSGVTDYGGSVTADTPV
jgi:hypothetical protein